jgi:2-phosphoglycerate kinase
VLHAAIPAEVAPELHLLDGHLAGRVDVWESPPAELVERYRRVSAYVAKAIEPVIAHHHIIGRRVVIEGCWILPSLAAQRIYAGRDTGDAVQAIFLREPDIAAIEARIRARPTVWLDRLPATAQRNHLEMQRLYGEAIAADARALGLPVLASQPLDTLEERALVAICGADAIRGKHESA